LEAGKLDYDDDVSKSKVAAAADETVDSSGSSEGSGRSNDAFIE
jgi:hypothetical protein